MATERVTVIYSLKDKLSAGLRNITRIAGVAFVAALGKSIFEAQNFEKTLTNVFTLLDKPTFEKFHKELEIGAKDIMSKYGFTVKETNKAMFDAVSAGVEAGKTIEFMNSASKLAIGGVTGLDVAVDGLTSVMNAYGKSNFDVTQASNVFFTAQKFGKTTVAELAANIGKVAPIASAAGMSFEETAAAMSTLTLSGLNTDLATTALKSTMTAIVKPASEAAGRFRELGIKLTDATGQMRPFGDIMADVREKTGGNVQELAKLFPNVRALTGVTKLATDALDKYDEILLATQTDTTSLQAAFEKQQNTFNQRWKIFLGTMRVIGIELGQKLLPVLGEILIAISKVAQSKAFKAFLDSVFKAIEFGIAIFKEFFGVIKSDLGNTFGALGEILKILFQNFKTMFLILFPTIKKIVSGLAAVFSNWINILASMYKILQNIGIIQLFAGVLKVLGEIIFAMVIRPMIMVGNVFVKFFKTLEKASRALRPMGKFFTSVFGGISKIINQVAADWLKFLKFFVDIYNKIAAKIPGLPVVDLGLDEQIKKLEDTNKAIDEVKEERAAKEEEEKVERDAKRIEDHEAEKERITKEEEEKNQIKKQKAAELTDAQKAEIKKEKDARDKAGSEFVDIAEQQGAEEKDIGKATAKTGAEFVKKKLVSDVKAKAAQLAAEGLAEMPLVLVGNPAGPLKLAAAAALGAAGPAAINAIKLQEGGIVPATPGGVPAIIGEGGRDEAVIPLEDEGARSRIGGGGGTREVIILTDDGSQLAKGIWKQTTRLQQRGELPT